jgi:transcription termination factor Rho
MLLTKEELECAWSIRKMMNDTPEFVEQFLRKMRETKSNAEFIDVMAKLAADGGIGSGGTGAARRSVRTTT